MTAATLDAGDDRFALPAAAARATAVAAAPRRAPCPLRQEPGRRRESRRSSARPAAARTGSRRRSRPARCWAADQRSGSRKPNIARLGIVCTNGDPDDRRAQPRPAGRQNGAAHRRRSRQRRDADEHHVLQEKRGEPPRCATRNPPALITEGLRLGLPARARRRFAGAPVRVARVAALARERVARDARQRRAIAPANHDRASSSGSSSGRTRDPPFSKLSACRAAPRRCRRSRRRRQRERLGCRVTMTTSAEPSLMRRNSGSSARVTGPSAPKGSSMRRIGDRRQRARHADALPLAARQRQRRTRRVVTPAARRDRGSGDPRRRAGRASHPSSDGTTAMFSPTLVRKQSDVLQHNRSGAAARRDPTPSSRGRRRSRRRARHDQPS